MPFVMDDKPTARAKGDETCIHCSRIKRLGGQDGDREHTRAAQLDRIGLAVRFNINHDLCPKQRDVIQVYHAGRAASDR